MSEELEKLQYLSDFFKRISAKVKLISLIENAKREYDKFDFVKGRVYLEDALNIDKCNPVALRGLGCIEQFNLNYDKAIEYYQRALQYSENKEIEYTLIGMVYYLQDKLDDAIICFNSAIDANDDYDKAYEGRNHAMLENHLKIIDLQESLKKYF